MEAAGFEEAGADSFEMEYTSKKAKTARFFDAAGGYLFAVVAERIKEWEPVTDAQCDVEAATKASKEAEVEVEDEPNAPEASDATKTAEGDEPEAEPEASQAY